MSIDDVVRSGRKAPAFAQVPVWLFLLKPTSPAVHLYGLLSAHVDRGTDETRVWPGMAAMAELMGYSKRQSLQPYVAELVQLGAISVLQEVTKTGRRNAYLVHEMPPEGFTGHLTMAEHYRVKSEVDGGLSAGADNGLSAGADMKKNKGKKNKDQETPSEGHPNADASRRVRAPEDPEPLPQPVREIQRRLTSAGTKPAKSPRTRRSSPESGPVMFRPRQFAELDDNRWAERVIACYSRALTAAGVERAAFDPAGLASSVFERLSEGEDRDDVFQALQEQARQVWDEEGTARHAA